MRRALVAAGCAILLLVGAERAAASNGSSLTQPAWDVIRQLTWPGAFVAALFSPVGRAVAGWITAATPAKPASVDKQLAEQLRTISETLLQVAEGVRRCSHIQEETARTLVKVQESLAILLDRTRVAR